jgi:uncharacterized protein (DUF1697 family)
VIRLISLLRGINVSGQNRINMPALKKLYESIGLVNVATYIQSGNVIFDCPAQDVEALAMKIEAEIERAFGLSVKVFLRNTNDFQEIIDNNPFLNNRKEDPEKLYVTFLSEVPSEPSLRNIIAATEDGGGGFFSRSPKAESKKDDTDEFSIYEKEVYLFCPNGYGRTKLSNSFFEKKLKVAATTRNWKTVKVLFEIANNKMQ